MRKKIVILATFLTLALNAGAQCRYTNTINFSVSAVPANGALFSIVAPNPPPGCLFNGLAKFIVYPTNTSFAVSNLFSGVWQVAFQGPPSQIVKQFYVDPTNAVQNPALATVAYGSQFTVPPDAYSYSISASDARYVSSAYGVTNNQPAVMLPGAFFSSPQLTNGVNYGAAFSSPGGAIQAEQFGDGASAAAENATAVGPGAYAGGPSAIALGVAAAASVEDAIGIGDSITVSGLASIGIGEDVLVLGDYAEAIGNGANVNSNYAIALGAQSTANYANSVAIGYGANTTTTNQIALGGPGTATVVQSNLTVLSGVISGNGSGLTNTPFVGPTNSTPPGNTSTIKAWVNYTNSAGVTFKLPLYQ